MFVICDQANYLFRTKNKKKQKDEIIPHLCSVSTFAMAFLKKKREKQTYGAKLKFNYY